MKSKSLILVFCLGISLLLVSCKSTNDTSKKQAESLSPSTESEPITEKKESEEELETETPKEVKLTVKAQLEANGFESLTTYTTETIATYEDGAYFFTSYMYTEASQWTEWYYKWTGDIKEGKLSGSGILTNYGNNKENLSLEDLYKTVGTINEATFKDGLLDGKFKCTFSDPGKDKWATAYVISYYNNGYREGESISYNKNNEIVRKEEIKDGIYYTYLDYSSDGELREYDPPKEERFYVENIAEWPTPPNCNGVLNDNSRFKQEKQEETEEILADGKLTKEQLLTNIKGNYMNLMKEEMISDTDMGTAYSFTVANAKSPYRLIVSADDTQTVDKVSTVTYFEDSSKLDTNMQSYILFMVYTICSVDTTLNENDAFSILDNELSLTESGYHNNGYIYTFDKEDSSMMLMIIKE